MDNIKVAKHFLARESAGRLLSFLLVLVMLMLVGCDKTKPHGESTTSSNPTSSDNSVSQNNDASEQTNVESESIDPLRGSYSYELTTSNINDTVEEIIPTGNTANLSNPLKGYADKEADALREEILSTRNTEEYYNITGKKYYISSINGDDLNSGETPEQALKTTEPIRSLHLQPGDALLFERGSVFRLASSILAEDGVIYGSYGEGEKPKFYTSPMNFVNANWTPSVKKNVWQINYIYADCGSMVFNHGKEIGYRRYSLRTLSKNTDFFQDNTNGVMYLYCDKGNPAKVYESIELCLRMSMINIPSRTDNVIIDNLCLKYGGVFGVSATYDSDNITVTNCEIGYIGGSSYSAGGRYGNAIQLWNGNKTGRFDHNWIYQTFDTAITWQGTGGEDFSYENISFSNNLLEYNNGDFEFWDKKSTVKNFTMENNIMRFTALGWGTRSDDAGSRGIEGCFVGDTVTMNVDNIVIKNNIIDCPGRMIINWPIAPVSLNQIKVSGTKIYVNSSYRTDTEIVRGFKHSDSDPNFMSATNADEFVAALKKFDSSAVLEWY